MWDPAYIFAYFHHTAISTWLCPAPNFSGHIISSNYEKIFQISRAYFGKENIQTAAAAEHKYETSNSSYIAETRSFLKEIDLSLIVI